MIHSDTVDSNATDPLDDIVGEALRADAARAPRLAQDWGGPNMMTAASIAPDRHGRLALFVGAAAAVILVTALALVARPNSELTSPASPPSPWTPNGIEFPLVDLGPATQVYDGPVVAALSRQIGVEGHPPQILTTSLWYAGNETAVEKTCTWEDGGGGCRLEWSTATWSTSVTSSIDNRVADYDLFTVEGLPSDIAFVSYADGDQKLWQRPISGFGAFPNVTGSDEIVIGYDALGVEVGRFVESERLASLDDGDLPLQADISRAQNEQLIDLTHDSMVACLTDHGGTIGEGDVATFADDVDQIGVWNDCVISVKQVVADAVTAMSPRFFDPVTERPENPDPATIYSD